MPVPRALILAASAAAALTFAGCGGSDGSSTAEQTPAGTSSAADAIASDAPATTPCALVGSAEAARALPGSKLVNSGSHGCIFTKDKESLEYQYVKASEMTKHGQYPDLYTVFRKGAKDDKRQSLINFTDVKIGDTGYITSQFKTPQSNIRWIHAGNLLSIKLTGFAKTESARKKAVAALEAAARQTDAAQPAN
ncbi:MAG: hypothetical protein AAGC46_16775 [Solirubrobacteraceae bacterium]|nr:hypothetical protein [Patulibacter sp.]